MADIQITFETQDGETVTGTTADLMQDLRDDGYNPVSVSPDGTTITMADDQGNYQMRLDNIVTALGHKLVSAVPQASDFSMVSPKLRAGVENMPDDESRRTYIQTTMQRDYGMATPQIMGSGSDWFVLNPETGGWSALTNKPGLDVSDISEIGTVGLKGLGGAVGGLAGGAAGLVGSGGLLSALGAMAGAGTGEALASGALKGGMALLDPNFQESSTLSTQLQDVAEDFGMGAGTAGAFGLAGRGLRGLAAKYGKGLLGDVGRAGTSIMEQGLVSPVVRKAGAGTKMVAEPIEKGLGKVAESRALTEFGQYALPVVGDVSWPGMLLRAPRDLIELGLKGSAKLGYGKGLAEEFERKGASRFGQQIGKRAGLALGGPTRELPGGGTIYSRQALERMNLGGEIGKALGTGVETSSIIGKGLTDVGAGVTKTGMRVGQAATGVTGRLGAAAEAAGRRASPYEAFTGTRAAMSRPWAEENINFTPWRGKRRRDTITDELQLALTGGI